MPEGQRQGKEYSIIHPSAIRPGSNRLCMSGCPRSQEIWVLDNAQDSAFPLRRIDKNRKKNINLQNLPGSEDQAFKFTKSHHRVLFYFKISFPFLRFVGGLGFECCMFISG